MKRPAIIEHNRNRACNGLSVTVGCPGVENEPSGAVGRQRTRFKRPVRLPCAALCLAFASCVQLAPPGETWRSEHDGSPTVSGAVEIHCDPPEPFAERAFQVDAYGSESWPHVELLVVGDRSFKALWKGSARIGPRRWRWSWVVPPLPRGWYWLAFTAHGGREVHATRNLRLDARPPEPAVNLLQNPGFEQGLHDGWRLWYHQHPLEAGIEDLDEPSVRVLEGRRAVRLFKNAARHHGGLYQRVAVKPGGRLRFSAWVQVWSSQRDEIYVSAEHGHIMVSVGIDPLGATDPLAPTVQWSQPIQAYDRWHPLVVETRALGDHITVFLRSQARYPVRHTEVYWDDACLVER